MAISWLRYTNLRNKTQCVGFFTRTYKTKHNTDYLLFLQDRKKVSVGILFQRVCESSEHKSSLNKQEPCHGPINNRSRKSENGGKKVLLISMKL